MGDYDPLISNSLGGSLMKDLFADLALGDDDFLSLDQLERELLEMELNGGGGSNNNPGFDDGVVPDVTPLTAAGLIVQQQQQQQQQSMHSMSLFGGPPAAFGGTARSGGGIAAATPALNASLFAGGGAGSFAPQQQSSLFPHVSAAADSNSSNSNNPASTTLDAWSLSLQSFSGTSLLHEDFLQADMVRKQQQQQQPAMPLPVVVAGPPPGLQNLPEYDISPPPPGLRAERAPPLPMMNLVEQAAQRLEGIQEEDQDSATVASPSSSLPTPPVPPNRIMTMPRGPSEGRVPVGILQQPPPPWHRTPPPPTPYSTPQHSVGTVGPSPPPLDLSFAPAPGGAHPPFPPPAMMVGPPPPPSSPAVVHQRPRIYANPHPTAEPVNAMNIPSKYMTPRDLCFVIHSILKPILTQNADAASTYHLEYWLRYHPGAPLVHTAHPARGGSAGGAGNNILEDQMASRSAKATEWSKENKVLGTTTKSVVTRPRALIAVNNKIQGDDDADGDHESSETSKNNQKQRAALWKARVRCDQGYACFTQLQHSAAARIKLLKCFGVQNGALDTTIFHGVLKLAKGRALLARTVEQYPEVIPLFLLPATLTVLAGGGGGDTPMVPVPLPITDLRLCGAWANVIASASTDLIIAQETLFLSCVQIVVDHGTVVLQDTSHMMIAHALLQRAGAAAAVNSTFATVYGPLEAKFMELLSTV